MEGYSALAVTVMAEPISPIVVRDPDDDAVLACALSADADVVVSGDEDLLILGAYGEIRILTAAALIAELFIEP